MEVSYIVVLITTSTDEEADRIAKALLNEKKAVCVNIIKGVQSHFLWEGRIDSCSEALLVVKTEKRLIDDIIGLVRSLHSYKVPEIIALPIIGGYEGYLNWVRESLRST